MSAASIVAVEYSEHHNQFREHQVMRTEEQNAEFTRDMARAVVCAEVLLFASWLGFIVIVLDKLVGGAS